jgi:type IV pilus assembly protein PilY1
MWGFIPYQLLPHLQWLTRTDYTHVYYVDLKPKVTDVRIFTPDSDHPNGWGTVLIGGFRMGGSCGSCTAGSGAPPMTVNIGGTSRTFYSAYFVLDITNPEVAPKLLWSFSSSDQGLATTYPTIVRMNPTSDMKASNVNAKWYVVFGSGPTGYDGSVAQAAKLFAIDLATGPGSLNSLVTTLLSGTWDSFMADLITLDRDLDYRADSIYVGRTIDPADSGRGIWSGKMNRLTMGTCSSAPCTTSTWGIASGSNRITTEIIDTFPASGTTVPGSIVSAPTVTLDDTGKVWIFFGTGRYYSVTDKTNSDTQYFFGIKDSVLGGACTQTTISNCWDNDLLNVSSATVCVMGVGDCGQSAGTNQVTGVTGVTTFAGSGTTSLIGLVQSKDGWYTTLPASRERVLASPTIIGGIVFFPSFIPNNDICSASGDSNLYTLFYLTGSAYQEPVIGTTAAGINKNVNRSMALGTGLASQMAVQIGSQGSGAPGAGPSGSGCQGGVIGFIQSSTGAVSQPCTRPALSTWSQYISWINQRD